MSITDRLITANESAERLNISIASFWRRVGDGTIPKPLKFGSLSRWPASDIDKVVEDAKAAREVA